MYLFFFCKDTEFYLYHRSFLFFFFLKNKIFVDNVLIIKSIKIKIWYDVLRQQSVTRRNRPCDSVLWGDFRSQCSQEFPQDFADCVCVIKNENESKWLVFADLYWLSGWKTHSNQCGKNIYFFNTMHKKRFFFNIILKNLNPYCRNWYSCKSPLRFFLKKD